jgi:hypothetical protein
VVVTPLPITFFTATLVWKDPSLQIELQQQSSQTGGDRG